MDNDETKLLERRVKILESQVYRLQEELERISALVDGHFSDRPSPTKTF